MSEKDAFVLREKIVTFIEDFVKVIDSSKRETMYCRNIDWFDATKNKCFKLTNCCPQHMSFKTEDILFAFASLCVPGQPLDAPKTGPKLSF